MKNIAFAMALTSSLAFAGQAHAAWTGDAELGFSSSSGNTETTIANFKLDMDHARDSWRHNIFGDIYYAEDSANKTAERYTLGYKPRYFMTDKDYVFGILRYDRDEFSFIDSRFTEVVGYGRQILNNNIHYLDGEIGLGMRQTDYVTDPTTVNLEENETIIFLGGKYTGKISDTTRFLQTLRLEFGDENTYIESITGLQVQVVGNLSAKISHTIRHNTDITGTNGENTDSLTGVNLLYSF